MTATARRRATAVHCIWFATVVVAVSGYALAFRLLEGRIDERATEVVRSVDQLRADGRVQAEELQLSGERARLRARLAPVSIAGDPTRLVARFVRDAERIAARDQAKITAISAAASVPFAPASASALAPQPGSPARPVPALAADPFQTIPLEVIIEGRYVNLLAAFRELSASPVLAQVEVGSLARKNVDAPDATLTALLHVTLERIAQPSSPPAAPFQMHDVRPQPQ